MGADTILSRFKLTQEQVQSAIPTVLDFARATGKDVPDAAKSVGKALLGNTRALKEVGISYKVTGNAAQDYTNILKLLNDKVGGQAAAYAQTFAGKLDILKARFDDVKEVVGGVLITDLVHLIDTFNEVNDVATQLGQTIADIPFDELPQQFKTIGLAAGQASGGDGMGGLVSSFRDIVHDAIPGIGGMETFATAIE